MKNSIEKNDKSFCVDRNILFFALKYALGRMTYAPIVVIDNIMNNINDLSNSDLESYIREIDQCENYGMDCDTKTWTTFSKSLKKELKNRLYEQEKSTNMS